MVSLVIDASSLNVQVGILKEKQWISFSENNIPALESIFTSVRHCLYETNLELKDINRLMYCEGPGSTLGIRLSSMACQTWARLSNTTIITFSFNNLYAIAKIIKEEYKDIKYPIAIVSESIENRWHCLMILKEDDFSEKIKELTITEIEKLNIPLFAPPPKKSTFSLEHKRIHYSLKPYPFILEELITPNENFN